MAQRAEELKLRPIGFVECAVSEPVDERWGDVESAIALDPAFAAGLRGLSDFSHALVLTFLHGASFEAARHLVRRPRGRADMPEIGIFSQRAKDRPNPIGVTCVAIVGVEGARLRVRGLDAIDGTPVLDVKPYFPVFDSAPGARVPAWVDELMKGYF